MPPRRRRRHPTSGQDRIPRGFAVLARFAIFDLSPETRLLTYLAWRRGVPIARQGVDIPGRDYIALYLVRTPVDRQGVARWVRSDLWSSNTQHRRRSGPRWAKHVRRLLAERNELERAAKQSPSDDYLAALFIVTDQLIRTFRLEWYRRTHP